jgi:hypothetical protein
MPGGESMVANATIDLPALRDARRRTGLVNMLSRQPFQAYAESYAGIEFQPANRSLDNGSMVTPERGDFVAWQQQNIDKLAKLGLI